MVPTRRRLLQGAAAGAAALAGCSLLPTGCTNELMIKLEPSPDDDLVARETQSPEDLHPVGKRLVREAGPDGAAQFRAIQEPPLPREGYLSLDGRYYAVETAVVEETTVTGYGFEASMDAETTPAADESAVAFEDLPSHDRRAFLAALDYPSPERFGELERMSGPVRIAYADEALVESSVLVPEPAHEYVTYEGRYVRLVKTGREEATVETHEVTLTEVATTGAELASLVRERRGVVLDPSSLSTEQREILDEAVGEWYSECEEFSEALVGLRDRLQDATYVEYDGTWYQVEVLRAVV